MTTTSTYQHPALAAISRALTQALTCYLDNVSPADDPPSLEGPLAFAFAAGYREAFKDVVVELTGDAEHDAYEYTHDPSNVIAAVLSVVPPDDPALAAVMYAATDYWTSAVPEGSRMQRLPDSPSEIVQPDEH